VPTAHGLKEGLTMKIVHATASFGFVSAEYEEDFEFEDDTSTEEIEEGIWEWARSFVEVSWEIEEETEE
jgi:hypothetical protein